MQTSKASSVSGGGFTDSCNCTSTSGWRLTKREITGATWLRPKPSVALMRRSPRGAWRERCSDWPSSSISPRMRRAHSATISPSGVRLMRRVVRLTSATPERCSISARRLLTAALDRPSSRAALLRLALPASVTTKPSSPGWMTGGMAVAIVHLRLTMDSL